MRPNTNQVESLSSVFYSEKKLLLLPESFSLVLNTSVSRLFSATVSILAHVSPPQCERDGAFTNLRALQEMAVLQFFWSRNNVRGTSVYWTTGHRVLNKITFMFRLANVHFQESTLLTFSLVCRVRYLLTVRTLPAVIFSSGSDS